MLEKQPLSEKLIIQCLVQHYGIEVDSLEFLPIGADNNASVYRACAHDKKVYFIKLKKGSLPGIGVAIQDLLHKQGLREVIPPIKSVGGELSCHIEEFTLIVYPFIEGKDGFARPLTDHQWIELGKALRQIHDMKLPEAIKIQIRKETYSSKWRNIVRELYLHIENQATFDDRLAWFIKENKSVICRLVAQSEVLSEKLLKQTPTTVLCHSDIHGGNVLLGRDETIYIVDWDDPILAPKERDLMFIGGGVGNVWNDPREEKFFFKGYGNCHVNRTILAYYRLERIVEDIAIYGQALLLSTSGGQDRQEMYKQFMSMFEPNGVVDIAFKTENDL
jgi:spectinomycin phosphotransferase